MVMSRKNSYTTSDYIPWDRAMDLIMGLFRDGNYRMSLLVGCGCFFGLRIGDLRRLSWSQIIRGEEFVVNEHKTGKRRVIRINAGFQKHIRSCHRALGITDDSQFCFLNRFGNVSSVQMINRQLKLMKYRYNLDVQNISTHSLRKTWARQIYENENAAGRGEQALLKLSELMNHSAPSITRRYIGLRQQELDAVYDGLKF